MDNLILLFNLVKTPTIRDKIILKVLYYAYLYIKKKRKREKPTIVVIERDGEWEEVFTSASHVLRTNPSLFCGK